MSTRPRRLLHDALSCGTADATLAARTVVVAEGRHHTYGELLGGARRLAGALRAGGLRRGDRVAVYMDNTWPCVVSIYGVLLAGGVFMLVNPQTKSDKLAFVLNDSGARVLLTDQHLAQQYQAALPDCPEVRAVLSCGIATDQGKVRCFETAVAAAEPYHGDPGTIPPDLAALIYTSGSTGNPKGVMQTHQSMLFAAGSLIQYLRLSASDRILVVLPIAFDYGLYQLLMAVELGATLVMERSFAFPAQVFARMRDEHVTVFPGVPTIYALLLSAHGREPLHFPEVTRVTNTAAALPDDFVTRLQQVFPHALIYKMYGLTECKRVCYLEPELVLQKPGSVGKAIPGTEVYLLSPTGEPTPPGDTGMLYVRGPHVMAGYWNRPDLTDHMLKPGKLPGERVLCTQDHFRMDAEGFLYFVGRSDDIIKTRGEKVSPVEVENAMHRIQGIREVAVVGVPDDVLGQALRAYVVLDHGAVLTEKHIRARCAASLESFMVPREIVFRDDLPKTVTGKVSRKALLEGLE